MDLLVCVCVCVLLSNVNQPPESESPDLPDDQGRHPRISQNLVPTRSITIACLPLT